MGETCPLPNITRTLPEYAEVESMWEEDGVICQIAPVSTNQSEEVSETLHLA